CIRRNGRQQARQKQSLHPVLKRHVHNNGERASEEQANNSTKCTGSYQKDPARLSASRTEHSIHCSFCRVSLWTASTHSWTVAKMSVFRLCSRTGLMGDRSRCARRCG